MRIDALVLAAGSGERFGGPTPKAFVELAGVPILVRAARAAAAAGVDTLAVVVGDPGLVAPTTALLTDLGPVQIIVVAGGATRVDSCRLGLAALGGADDDVVIVHDAARPLATLDTFRRVLAAIAGGADAATPVVPSADTIAVLDGDRVADVPDRSSVARVQTPQAFRRGILRRAHAAAHAIGDAAPTDDCGLVLRYAPEARVVAVAGDERNLKITRPADLETARGLLVAE